MVDFEWLTNPNITSKVVFEHVFNINSLCLCVVLHGNSKA